LKVLSPAITHKTDVGGVVLNLASDADVCQAFERICQNARERAPHAQILGVTVQRMLQPNGGLELILGAKRDATFGAVMLIGTGGITAELSQDRALGLPPLNERLARRMLMSLRSWPLLNGYRGRPGVDIDRLIELMIRFSYFIADYPEIREFDINPLLVQAAGACALDARAVLDHSGIDRAARPYAHLVIRPYPEEYTRPAQTKTGTPVLLRAIRPEDEPAWHALLAACSPESIRARFRSLFSQTTHAMASRFCFIDYDRELAIVAEIGDGEQKRLVAVGRIVADANHETAEFAVLVADPWQGQGLGSLLTGYCLEIARGWGIKQIVAETEWQNRRMLSAFHEAGFEVREHTHGTVYVAKDL
jgi:acetyltransferase